MIHEGYVNVQFAERELHLVQFVDIHSGGEFTHRYRKERRFHRLRHNLAKCRPGSVKTENTDFVFRIVRRLKKWKALDVVPVGMSNQQREFYRSRLKFSFQGDTKRPDARACVEHDNLAVCSQLYASGVAAVTQSFGTGHCDRATCPPKLNSCRRCRCRDAGHWMGERGFWHAFLKLTNNF